VSGYCEVESAPNDGQVGLRVMARQGLEHVAQHRLG